MFQIFFCQCICLFARMNVCLYVDRCVCVHVYVFVFKSAMGTEVYRCVYTCVYLSVETRAQHWVSFPIVLPYFMNRALSQTRPMIWPNQLRSKHKRSSCPGLLSAEHIGQCHQRLWRSELVSSCPHGKHFTYSDPCSRMSYEHHGKVYVLW